MTVRYGVVAPVLVEFMLECPGVIRCFKMEGLADDYLL